MGKPLAKLEVDRCRYKNIKFSYKTVESFMFYLSYIFLFRKKIDCEDGLMS